MFFFIFCKNEKPFEQNVAIKGEGFFKNYQKELHRIGLDSSVKRFDGLRMRIYWDLAMGGVDWILELTKKKNENWSATRYVNFDISKNWIDLDSLVIEQIEFEKNVDSLLNQSAFYDFMQKLPDDGIHWADGEIGFFEMASPQEFRFCYSMTSIGYPSGEMLNHYSVRAATNIVKTFGDDFKVIKRDTVVIKH